MELWQASAVGSDRAAVNLLSHRPGCLAGRGLTLREWEQGDLPAMVDLFDESDIARRTPLPSPFTLADAQDRLARAGQPDRLLLAVTADGRRPLGEVLLTATGELGYMIGKPHRRLGLATRALVLLRDYAHDAVGLAVLRLKIEPDNDSSIAVAQRAGFQLGRAAAEVVEHKGRRCVLDVWEHILPRPSGVD